MSDMLADLAERLVWPTGMAPERFLREHWQRRPLFMPGALPGIAELLDPDELAGLACEAEVESRLIIQHADGGWTLEQGPFDAQRFASLPDRGWTLLVQDVDKHLPELAALFQRFSFIPSWRLDDLMISYAAPGGSVGAHLDSYDVFLVQGAGSRSWSVGSAEDPQDLVADAPLKLLAEFRPQASHEMQPGDALYIPPGVPHHGVSEVPCMTWSVGFRAPARGALAANLLRRRLEVSDAEALYADGDLIPDEADAGLISTAALRRARSFMRPVLETVDLAELTLALGITVTTPKPWLQPAARDEDAVDVAALRATAMHAGLQRHGYALLARSEAPAALYACGQLYPSEAVDPALVRDLCALRELPASRFEQLSEADWTLVTDLYRDGILLTAADLDTDGDA